MEIEVQVAVGTESRPINNPEPFRFVSDIKSAQARPSRVTLSPGEEGRGGGREGRVEGLCLISICLSSREKGERQRG